MDYVFDIVDAMDEKVLFAMMQNKDAFEILDYVRSFVREYPDAKRA